MNDMNNNENVNQVATTPVEPVAAAPVPAQPVQEVVSSPQSVAPTPEVAPQAPAPAAAPSPAPSPVETPAASEPEKAPEKVEASSQNGTDDTEGKLRFPLVVVLLLVVVILFLFVYYFVLITPKSLFAKALKAQINGMTSTMFMTKSDHKTATYLIDSKFEATEEGDVSFLNGLEYKFNLNHDVEKGNFGLNVISNIDALNTSDKIEHNQNINSSFYYFDRSILFQFSDAVLKTDTHGDSADNSRAFVDLINEFSYEFIDLIDVTKVKRTIESKDVKDQSLLAIRFSTSFDTVELNRLWDTTIDNLLDNAKHPDFVKNFAVNLDITDQEAAETLRRFKNFEIKNKEVKLDYYINLACTNLVAFELSIDNITFDMGYLSGYYFLDVDTEGFDIDFSYNMKTSDFGGELVIDNEKTYSLIKLDSVTKLNDKYEKIGNTLDVHFYNENAKNSSVAAANPYLSVKNNITYSFDKKVEFFDSSKVIPIENASAEDLEKLSYVTNKMQYELFYIIGLNSVNRTEMTPRMFAEDMLNSIGQSIIQPSTPNVPPVLEQPVQPETNVPEVNEPSNNEEVVVPENNVE